MSKLINVADLTNPESGLTYRQENNNKVHAYIIGQPVKIEGGKWVRITKLARDCDGSPLYSYESHGLGEDSIVDYLLPEDLER